MRVLKSEVLYQGRLRAVRDLVEYPDGKHHSYETIEHPGAVVILPVTKSGTIMFVEQYRHALKMRFLELPAGTLERGEAPAVCAKRELMEEVGMAPGELVSLGVLYPAPGFCNEIQHLFLAKDLREQKATPDEDEAITIKELSLAEVDAVIESGQLCDAKSLSLILRAKAAKLL